MQQSREVAKELEKGSSYELTGAKLEKKEQLLREGFVDWSATRRGDVSIHIYIYVDLQRGRRDGAAAMTRRLPFHTGLGRTSAAS